MITRVLVNHFILECRAVQLCCSDALAPLQVNGPKIPFVSTGGWMFVCCQVNIDFKQHMDTPNGEESSF